jgi:hypothetical protein
VLLSTGGQSSLNWRKKDRQKMIKPKGILLVIYLCALLLLNLPAALRNYIGYIGAQQRIGPDWVNVYFAEEKSDKKYVTYVQYPHRFDENGSDANSEDKGKTPNQKVAVEVWIRTWYQSQPMQELACINLYLTGGFIVTLIVAGAFERNRSKRPEQKSET